MAYTRGRCTNLDYCSLAAARQDIEVRVGEDFICPECAKPLRPPPTRQGGGGATNLAIAGGAVALLLIGGGIYAGYRLSSSSAASARTAMLAPATATLAAAPRPATLALRQDAAASASVPAAPSVLLRVAAPPALTRGVAAGLATAYLAALGDTDISVQLAGSGGELRVTGQRLSRPETIALRPASPAGGQGRFAELASGQADVVLADSRVTQAELDNLRSLGDLTAPANEHRLGQQAVAVVVNQQNPTRQLTMQQVRGILDGSIDSWRVLGVSGPPIHSLAEQAGPRPADLAAGWPEAGRPRSSGGRRRRRRCGRSRRSRVGAGVTHR